ncbi:uncharacterized protein LOC107304620 [Oryza brachyantha]|uniref:Uncharacterized protein n=1 Tax=Oryza brachyantha TaxID=4533 RepID=J3MN76_ORYBR|nr:uncharacterized protein LOC107304620 [Oryza brachyantha]
MASLRVPDLIAAILERQPILAFDRTFLRRALIVEGVSTIIPPRFLEMLFGLHGDVTAAVLLRDHHRHERIGMVVFATDRDLLFAVDAAAQADGRTSYRSISMIRDHVLRDSENVVNAAVEQRRIRSSTAEAFRRTIPQRYVDADVRGDLPLRCLLLRMTEGNTAMETPGHLYAVARTTLRATGRARALAISRTARVAVVVFDDTRGIERCGDWCLDLMGLGLSLYDSGLFPLGAYAAGGQGVAVLDLIPRFCRSPEFPGSVVVLRGPGIGERDAGETCQCIEQRHPVEALLAHRAEQAVVVVLSSRDGADALAAESGEFWRRAFGTQLITAQVIGAPSPPSTPPPLPSPDEANSAPGPHPRQD